MGDHLGQTMISLPRIFTLELNGTPFPVQCSHAIKNDIGTLCAQIERYLRSYITNTVTVWTFSTPLIRLKLLSFWGMNSGAFSLLLRPQIA